MSQDPENQLQLFRQAVELLGGTGAAMRYLKVSERQVRGLLSGERTLHDGFLGDIATALIEHADTCRKLERRISPAFAGNLTEAQAKGTTNRGRRTDLEAKRNTRSLIDQMGDVRATALANYRTPARWELNEAARYQVERELEENFAGPRGGLREFMGLPVTLNGEQSAEPKFTLHVLERHRG